MLNTETRRVRAFKRGCSLKLSASKVSMWAGILSVPPLTSWYLDHFPSIHAQVPASAGFASLSAGLGLAIVALVANAVAHANLDRLLSEDRHHQQTQSLSPYERKDVKTAPVKEMKAQFDSVFYPFMTYQPPTERILTDKSPQELTDFFRNFIDVQAQKLIEPFLGKWLKIVGPVTDASHYKDSFWQVFIYVEDKHSSFGIQISLLFADTWTERLSLITHGTTISTIGRINKVGKTGIELHACELV